MYPPNEDERKIIKRVLETLFDLNSSPQSRKSIFVGAFSGSKSLINGIPDLSVRSDYLSEDIIDYLIKYGKLNNRQPALLKFIEYIIGKELVGLEDREDLSKILSSQVGESVESTSSDGYTKKQPPSSEILNSQTNENSHPRPPCVHIIVGGKGGVGKTLITLGAMNSYIQKTYGRRAIFIDANTSNNSLYELIFEFTPVKNRYLGTKIPKLYLLENVSNRWDIINSEQPYDLHGGTKGFWDSVADIALRDEYLDHDIFVDTNLNIPNLFTDGDAEEIGALKRLFNHQKYVIVWMIWTASMARQPIIVERIERFERNLFKGVAPLLPQAEGLFQVVHVINPSALMHPNTDDEKARALTKELDEILETLRSVSETAQRLASDPEELKVVQANLGSIERATNNAKRLVEKFQDPIRSFEPLQNLQNGEVSKQLFSLPNMVEYLQKHSQGASFDFEAFAKEFNARPSNLLLIPMYDVRLKGYTESKYDEEALWATIGEISKSVNKFLSDLYAALPFLSTPP
jgi:hypothetical protein